MTRSDLINIFPTTLHITTAEIEILIDAHMKDAQTIIGGAVDSVLNDYSRDLPRRIVFTGAWNNAYFSLPDWEEYSKILQIETPTGLMPILTLNRSEYTYDINGTVFLTATIGAGYKITYTGAHVITDDVTDGNEPDAITTPGQCTVETDSYCALVAVKLCRALAQYYTDVQRSNLSMDLVDQSKNAALYAARAEEKYKEYRRLARLSDTPKKYAASWAKVNKPRFTIFPDSMR